MSLPRPVGRVPSWVVTYQAIDRTVSGRTRPGAMWESSSALTRKTVPDICDGLMRPEALVGDYDTRTAPLQQSGQAKVSELVSVPLWLCMLMLSSPSLGVIIRSARAGPASAKPAALAAADRSTTTSAGLPVAVPYPCSHYRLSGCGACPSLCGVAAWHADSA
jgi:hypothetical protein